MEARYELAERNYWMRLQPRGVFDIVISLNLALNYRTSQNTMPNFTSCLGTERMCSDPMSLSGQNLFRI